MNFLQYSVWGAYLTSMGAYLGGFEAMRSRIGTFYAMQGLVSLFMPALMGIVADRWIEAQKLLGICHGLAAAFMFAAGLYCLQSGAEVAFAPLFTLYTLSVAFYMPTIALSNSVAYTSLGKVNLDTVKHFPPIRIFGTIGFICSMLFVNFAKTDGEAFQNTPIQFVVSAVLGIVLAVYAFTLPRCETDKSKVRKSLAEALGLNAFVLFRQKKMAIFFIFSMLLGALQRLCQRFYTQLRQHTRVCRYVRSQQCQCTHLVVADERNVLYLAHSVFPPPIWYKKGDADVDVRLGISVRALRGGQPRQRSMGFCAVDDSLWHSVRLLQYIGFALRGARDRQVDSFEFTRTVYDDDQRTGGNYRYVCCSSYCKSLCLFADRCFGKSSGLANVVVRLCGIRSGSGGRFCLDI